MDFFANVRHVQWAIPQICSEGSMFICLRINHRAEKRLRMFPVDSFWRIFYRLINEKFSPLNDIEAGLGTALIVGCMSAKQDAVWTRGGGLIYETDGDAHRLA